MRFSARLTPRPLVLDEAAKAKVLRASVLPCPRCGEALDGAGPADSCAACRVPLTAVFGPGRLIFSDLQCLRVIQRSAVVGIAANAAVLAGQVVEWVSPFGQAGVMLLAPGYIGLALAMVYLSLGLALFGQWWSMRLIAAALLLAVLFRVATFVVPNANAITIEMQDIVRLNAVITLPLCVSMMAVGRLLGSPAVVAGFLTAGVVALIQAIGAEIDVRMYMASSMSRYVLDECVVRLVLLLSFVAALRPIAVFTRSRREIDRVLGGGDRAY